MNAQDAERAVLGSLLVTDAAMPFVMIDERLRPNHFRMPSHHAIYATMVALAEAGEAFDRGIVRARLNDDGHREVLDGLGSSASVAHLRSYVRIVRDAFTEREVERIAREALAGIAERSITPADLRDRMISQAMEVETDSGGKQARNIAEAMSEEAERIHKTSTGEIAAGGIPTGFDDLDRITGGLRKKTLTVLAARPAQGKSTVGANIAENVAVSGKTVLLFSFEMSDDQIAQRMIAGQAHVRGDDLRDGRIRPDQWERILAAGHRMSNHMLLVDDHANLSIGEVQARARRVHRKTPVDLIVVDYLQRMRKPKGVTPEQATGAMSWGLKVLASELDVPVLALAQLSRALETRGTTLKSKEPQLSDLRESGQIEQDADIVMFLFRPDYYEADERPGEADVIVEKNRHSGLGTATLTFMPEYLRFVSMSRRQT